MPTPVTLEHRRDAAGRWEVAVPVGEGSFHAARRVQGYREDAAGPVHRRELPGPDLVLVASFGPAIRVGGENVSSFVAGLGTAPTDTEHAGRAFGIQVDLPPLEAYRLLGQPLDALADQAVSLEDALGPGAAELIERLREAAGWARRFELLEAFLRDRSSRGPEPPAAVAWAWRMLERSDGRLPIGDLAKELGCSRRYLVAQFRRCVGLPPKAYARVLRFRAALRRLSGDPSPRLDELALDAGYFDQAHMNREFLRLAGTSPRRLLTERPTAPVTFVQG